MPGTYQYDVEIKSNVAKLLSDMKQVQDRLDTVEGKEYKIKLNVDEKKLSSVISNLEKMLDSLGKGTGDFKQFENLSKELSSIVSEVQSLSKAFGKVDDSGTNTLLSSIQNIDKSLAELSQNILNVNKNMSNMGGNTSGAVKEIENITNESKQAAKALDDVAETQAKVDNSKKSNSILDKSFDTKNKTEAFKQLKDSFKNFNGKDLLDGFDKSGAEVGYSFWRSYEEAINKGVAESRLNEFGDVKYNKQNLSDGIVTDYKNILLDYKQIESEIVKNNNDIFPSLDDKSIENINEYVYALYRVREAEKEISQINNIPINQRDNYDLETLSGANSVKEYYQNQASNNREWILSQIQNQTQLQETLVETREEIRKTSDEINNLSSTASQSQLKDAFPDKDISVSVEFATNYIKEENDVLDQNTQKVKENTQAKEQNANVNLNKYDKRLDSYNGKIDKYQATIDRFNDGGWTSSAYLENVQAIKNAVNEYETLLNKLKGKDASLVTSEDINRLDKYEKKIKDTIATVTNMSAAEKGYNFVSAQKELDKIHKILTENSRMSSDAKNKIRTYYKEIESGNPSMSLDKIHGEIMKIVNAEVEAGRAGKSMWESIKEKAWYGAASAIGTYFGVNDIFRYGREAIQTVREFDTALTEMRKVSDETVRSLKNYQSITFDTADAVGTTAKQIQNSTADYMRLGESLDEAAESAKTANILLNVSEFTNIEDATKSLVSMGQAYKDLDKMTIVDKLNEIGNNYSISTDELATSLQRSAATLSLMGNTIDEAASLVTTANATIQDADSVSAGLRTISLRLVGTEEAEEELSAMNEEVDAFVKATNSKKQQIIKDYTAVASNNYQGFDILDNNGNYKNTYEILLGIAKVYKEIQEQDKKLGTNHATAIIEELAGKNRSNIASAILQDPAQLEAVKKSSEEAFGSATEELNKYLDSIDGKMAQLENRAQEFWFKVIDSETIKNGIDLLSTLLKGATDFVDTVGLLPTILTGVGAALSFKNVGRDKMYSLTCFEYADNIHNLLWIHRFRAC